MADTCIDIDKVFEISSKVRPLRLFETRNSRIEEIKKRSRDYLFYFTPDLRRAGWIKKPLAVKNIKDLKLPEDASIYDVCYI